QVKPGDVLRLVSPTSGQLALGIPTWGEVEVQNVFRTGIPIFDDNVCFIPLQMGQQLFRTGTSVSGIDFRLIEGGGIETVAKNISVFLPEGLTVTSWREQHKLLFSAMELEKLVGTVVLSLIIIVASFGIASTLIMLIMEKVRELGILRAMGASRKVVGRIFTFQGLLIGGLGALSGLVVGLIFISAQMKWEFLKLPETIYLMPAVPMALSAGDVLILVSVAGAVISLASIYPARVASRLSPTEAIQIEK
ncbi:MAG: ABC transporter permease, partial [Fidelibacterota bacterium]